MLIFFQYGFLQNYVMRFFKFYGFFVLLFLQENLYFFLDVFLEFDFKKVDRFVFDMGVMLDDRRRIFVKIFNFLILAVNNEGYICLLENRFKQFCLKIFDFLVEKIEEVFEVLEVERRVVKDEVDF